MIQTNLIHACYKAGVKKLMFLGSSCVYPKFSKQPIKEKYLLSGYLESTNDAYAIAKIAGIMAAKRTDQLIPLCHTIPLSYVNVDLKPEIKESCINIKAEAALVGKTGVEMEAFTAVSVAALTIYDMCKSIDREMVISDIKLIHKSGGKSGEFNAKV